MAGVSLDGEGKGSSERTRKEREELVHRELNVDKVSGLFRSTGKYGLQKLNTIRGYLWSYSVIMAKRFAGNFAYVDGMSGPGFLQVGDYDPKQMTVFMQPPRREIVLGSPMLGLSNHPHFPIVHLVESSREIFKALKARVDHYYPGRASVNHGDCNDLVPKIAKEMGRTKAFFLLDPEGLELDFQTIRAVKANCPGAEMFVLYPYHMAVRRCLNHEDSEERLDGFFGSPEWRALRDECAAKGADKKEAEKVFLDFYMKQIKAAGFRLAFPLDVVRSDQGRDLYFLIFAGDSDTGAKIMKDIDERVRALLSE